MRRVVLVCGGRSATDPAPVFDFLDAQHAEDHITMILEGGQRTKDQAGNFIGGVDYFAQQWADARRVHCVTVPAQWDFYGNGAGMVRNQFMIDEFRPDLGIAFPGGPGTADMVRKLKRSGIKLIEVKG